MFEIYLVREHCHFLGRVRLQASWRHVRVPPRRVLPCYVMYMHVTFTLIKRTCLNAVHNSKLFCAGVSFECGAILNCSGLLPFYDKETESLDSTWNCAIVHLTTFEWPSSTGPVHTECGVWRGRTWFQWPLGPKFFAVFFISNHGVQLELPPSGPVHTGRGAPCNRCKQIMGHTAVNGSVHTGCKQHQRLCAQICMQICLRALCERGLRVRLSILNSRARLAKTLISAIVVVRPDQVYRLIPGLICP